MALIGSLDTGVSALRSFSKGIEVVGNNIANVNTIGYKASRSQYEESFAQIINHSGVSPNGANGSNITANQIGGGVDISRISTKFNQGSLQQTGVRTDLAIVGEGYFQVKDTLNNTTYATRDGSFRVDDKGFLVNSSGMRLQGLAGGTISYDVTDVGGQMVFTPTIGSPTGVGDLQTDYDLAVGGNVTNSTGGTFTDAQVAAAMPRVTEMRVGNSGSVDMVLSNGDTFTIGQVLLMDFSDQQALIRQGNGLYTGFQAAGAVNNGQLTAANGTPNTGRLGRIQDGTIETSNVDLTEEFATIISLQRSFQAGARIVTTSDDILQEVVNLKR